MGEFTMSRIFCREQPNLHQVRTLFFPSTSPQTCTYRIKVPAVYRGLLVLKLEHEANNLVCKETFNLVIQQYHHSLL